MFERFTDRARRVVVIAQEQARLRNHNYIGTEHILLGLIHEGNGIAGQVLTQLGYSIESLNQAVNDRVPPGKQSVAGHIPFTPRTKKMLELSLREALQLGHNYVGTEHLLLGVIREGEGVGWQILEADLHDVRKAVIVKLSARADANKPPSPKSAIERVRTNDRLRGYQDIELALEEAYAAGRASMATEVVAEVDAHEDKIAGSIDKLHMMLGDLFDTREVGLALNEAFRNGMREAERQAEASAPKTQETIKVRIPGLKPLDAGCWTAYRSLGEEIGNPPRQVFVIEGDPNAVAVGRFKAQLRKFLGV